MKYYRIHWKKDMKVLCLLFNKTLTIQGQGEINCENDIGWLEK